MGNGHGVDAFLYLIYIVSKAVKQQTLETVYDYFINIKYIANIFLPENN